MHICRKYLKTLWSLRQVFAYHTKELVYEFRKTPQRGPCGSLQEHCGNAHHTDDIAGACMHTHVTKHRRPLPARSCRRRPREAGTAYRQHRGSGKRSDTCQCIRRSGIKLLAVIAFKVQFSVLNTVNLSTIRGYAGCMPLIRPHCLYQYINIVSDT